MSLFVDDTGALVKLVLPEAESAALRARAADQRLLACALVASELPRAVRRPPEVDLRAVDAALAALLPGLVTVPVDARLLHDASVREPPELRTLDALHLAAALVVRGHFEAFLVHDQRLAEAARTYGLPVLAPR